MNKKKWILRLRRDLKNMQSDIHWLMDTVAEMEAEVSGLELRNFPPSTTGNENQPERGSPLKKLSEDVKDGKPVKMDNSDTIKFRKYPPFEEVKSIVDEVEDYDQLTVALTEMNNNSITEADRGKTFEPCPCDLCKHIGASDINFRQHVGEQEKQYEEFLEKEFLKLKNNCPKVIFPKKKDDPLSGVVDLDYDIGWPGLEHQI